MKEKENNIINT